MDPRKLSRELKEILLHDHRPAFLFIGYDGKFPMKDTHCGETICPYCARSLQENEDCICSGYRKAREYNRQIDNP